MSDVENKSHYPATEHMYSPDPNTTPNNSVLVDITTSPDTPAGCHYSGICDDEKDSPCSSLTGTLLILIVPVSGD